MTDQSLSININKKVIEIISQLQPNLLLLPTLALPHLLLHLATELQPPLSAEPNTRTSAPLSMKMNVRQSKTRLEFNQVLQNENCKILIFSDL